MPIDKKRAQSQTDRDLQSPHLGLRPAPGEIEDLADEYDSDGVPVVKQGPDQSITPKPYDIESDPLHNAQWDHVNHRYQAASDKVAALQASFLGSADAREKLDKLEMKVNDHASFLRVVKVAGGVATLVFGALIGIVIHAIYGSGLDKGTVSTTLTYVQRQIEVNQQRIDANNAELHKLLERIDDKIDEHIRYHTTRGSNRSAPSAAGTAVRDPGDQP